MLIAMAGHGHHMLEQMFFDQRSEICHFVMPDRANSIVCLIMRLLCG